MRMYDGVEVDMLSLGDADCILVTFWNGFTTHRVLIDGGNKGDAAKVRDFLASRGITYIDDVLVTHLHDDHSGGLLELLPDATLGFGKLWCHVPHFHVPNGDMVKVRTALKMAGSSLEAQKIQKSLGTVESLWTTAERRGIPRDEPFEGKRIGNLVVCSPTVQFYEGLVVEMTDVEKIKAEDAAEERYDRQTALEEKLSKALTGDSAAGSSLLTDPHTSPENESSVVTGTAHNGKVILLTADAGTCALTNVARDYKVQQVQLFQIPHHGSRRNITQSLIDIFAPKIAYVSAIGNVKHPRRAVVNAFKKAGTQVFGTHYPYPGALRYSLGSVPVRNEYGQAVSLWNAEVAESVA
jgi:beta-lactamase superfamily II metal-dependent hydrolase